jgi:HAD superfamily hydrolase (TIGR01509 family)
MPATAPARRVIIFDCDGVLVDSEPLSCAIAAEEFTRVGFPITAEFIAANFTGKRDRDMCAAVEAAANKALPADFLDVLAAATIARFRTSLQPMPHAAEVLAGLTEPICVASSSRMDRLRMSLEVTGLLRFFEPHLFSATQVARGKPAPDLFLHSAASMGTAPAACIVVEDAPAGVAAAVAAAMAVIGFVGGAHAGPQMEDDLRAAGAAVVIADLRELPDVIAGLRKAIAR